MRTALRARVFSVLASLAVAAPFATACVPEVGTQTRSGECEGPGSKACRGNLECMAGRCACRTDVCNGGNCDINGDCIPPPPAASFPSAPPAAPAPMPAPTMAPAPSAAPAPPPASTM